jgi:predicted nucleic acid-binding protein
VSLYIDASALLKRYVEETDSARCDEYMMGDPEWITARHTAVEVRRNLARLLAGAALVAAREDFAADWRRFHVIELDEDTCDIAAQIAETTGCRSLDALHIAAASRVGGAGALTFLTWDVRQAQAVRALGIAVAGA